MEKSKYRLETGSPPYWLFVVLGVVALITSYGQQLQRDKWDALCPGSLSIAPGETTTFASGASTFNVRHNGISLGPDNVSVSVVDSASGKTIFGGTVQVETGEKTPVEGLHFQDRGTEDQSMTDILLTLTQTASACVEIELPEN